MKTRFVFWDVQHGNATYISTPSGKHLSIDLGTGKLGNGNTNFSPLQYLKNQWGVSRLDGVIVTHPHKDHLDDIFNFDGLKPGMLHRPSHLTDEEIRANNREDLAVVNKYLEINRRYNQPIDAGVHPFKPGNNGGIEIQTYIPSSCPTSNLNNHSAVAVISYADSKILIPGDNEFPSWKELLARQDFRNAIKETDILLAPHHGREAGFSKELFEHITPRLVIISDGPSGSTSVTNSYAANAQGWKVHKRSGGSEQRKCVTMRKDGVVVVDFGRNQDGNPFISVNVD